MVVGQMEENSVHTHWSVFCNINHQKSVSIYPLDYTNLLMVGRFKYDTVEIKYKLAYFIGNLRMALSVDYYNTVLRDFI